MKDCPEITRLRNLAKLIGGNQIRLIEEYKNKLAGAQAKIAHLESQLELSQHIVLASDDCYYWNPESWKEFNNLKKIIADIQKILLLKSSDNSNK